jgi:hypothetical protein
MRTPEPVAMTDPADSSRQPETQALSDALNAVLMPLARLAVARGVHFSVLEEQLKMALVHAALESSRGGQPHRQVSRISTATGINRREVSRLVSADLKAPHQKPSLAMRAYYRWSTDPLFLAEDGQVLALKRQGASPSFDTLASLVTRDVHPRSLLEDMVRLKAAQWDAETDTVTLSDVAFVSSDDDARLLEFLGANVGDHLSAAVDNVAGVQPRHFEQSVRGHGLAAGSMQAMRPLVEGQWKLLTRKLVPELQRRVEADEASDQSPQGEVRIGLYMYSHMPAASASGQGKEPHEDS